MATEMPGGKIRAEAGMPEEVEEREDVCAICFQILSPDDDVVTYGSGLAHRECKEREDQK